MTLELRVEFEREAPRRWIADIPNLSGVMAYGTTRSAAGLAAQALAFEVLADRLAHFEHPLTGRPTRTCAFVGLVFACSALG